MRRSDTPAGCHRLIADPANREAADAGCPKRRRQAGPRALIPSQTISSPILSQGSVPVEATEQGIEQDIEQAMNRTWTGPPASNHFLASFQWGLWSPVVHDAGDSGGDPEQGSGEIEAPTT